MAMNIFQFFSCFTKLPVRIDDIRTWILDRGTVDGISFHRVPMNTDLVKGFLRVRQQLRYYDRPKTHADVVYSADLDRQWARIIAAKELGHIEDDGPSVCGQPDVLERLIREVTLPRGMKGEIGAPAKVDGFGVARAVVLLFPRDARDELMPLLTAKKITTRDIAQLADLPEGLVEFLMTDPDWAKFQDNLAD